MQLSIVDEYPTESAFGCDYFTRAARGEVRMDGPDGLEIRPEKIIVTDRYLDYEGQICVGERTVRHLAHALEMVDGWRVDKIIADSAAVRAELLELSMQLAQTRDQLRFAQDLERATPVTTFVSIDGTEHASRRAAMEAGARSMGLELKAITEAVPVPLSDPATEDSLA